MNESPPPDLSTLSINKTRSSSSSDASNPLIPPHRSHSPTSNLKRSDPFQFGSRYLLPTDDPYEFNAWDQVETDSTYDSYAQAQYTFQRTHAVSPFDASRFNTTPEKWWDKFYGHHTANFFKDRKWLKQEFPILERLTRKPAAGEEGEGVQILEVGAGAGNTAFPILRGNENPNLLIHACDFSKKAVELIRSDPDYNPTHIRAEVWDIASTTETLPLGVEEDSIDIVLLIFIFSALSPAQWNQAVRNVWKALKPGGEVCFRDYGRGDLAQVRFKKGRWLEDNFYVRGDGTRVYFFEADELRRIWGSGLSQRNTSEGGGSMNKVGDDNREDPKPDDLGGDSPIPTDDTIRDDSSSAMAAPTFEILNLGVDRRLLVNRRTQIKMHRCWMQGRFRKPCISDLVLDTSTQASSRQGIDALHVIYP